MTYNNKKISSAIILVSILMLVYGLITKDYDGSYFNNKQKIPPLDLFDVSLFGWDVDYKNYMLFFIIILSVGAYLYIFKTDESLKTVFKGLNFKPKMPKISNELKLKYKKYEKKHTQTVEISKQDNKQNNIVTLVEVVTFLAMGFTFYMGVETGFSLWFFIILSYFYYLVWKPKSIRQILIKAILYPLIFMILFTLSESSRVIYFSFFYQMSRHILPYLISVIVIFFTQRHKLNNQPSFSFRNPLFWISLLCLIVAALTMVVDYNI